MKSLIKSLFFIFLVIATLSFYVLAHAESINVSTYYPPPYGVYNQLKILSDSDGISGTGAVCSDEGAMYYDDIDNQMLLCGNSGQWQQVGGSYWRYQNPDGTCHDYLYPVFTNINLGIGTQTPEFKLSLGSDTVDGGMYLKGFMGGCTPPTVSVGSGPRLFWWGYGGDFRAGYACGNDWETVNLGGASIAMGYCANAFSNRGLALGTNAKTLYGHGSFHTAIGNGAVSEGDHSVAIGSNVVADMGLNLARDGGTVAIGHWVEAQSNWSAVIGRGINDANRLINTIDSSLMVGFNSNVPSFLVGPTDTCFPNAGCYLGNVNIWTNTVQDRGIYALYVNGIAGGTVAWSPPSDERLKKDIKPIPNALDKVMKLRGVNFQWKDPKTYAEGTKMGIIAQEAKDITPEVVHKGSEYYSMDYGSSVALLIEAVKEQQQEIVALQKQIEARKKTK